MHAELFIYSSLFINHLYLFTVFLAKVTKYVQGSCMWMIIFLSLLIVTVACCNALLKIQKYFAEFVNFCFFTLAHSLLKNTRSYNLVAMEYRS